MRKSSFALVRVLAMIGLAISAYLLIQKLNGTISSIKGCGGVNGGANVLGSKWFQWFGIPVSVFSTVLYLGIIGLTFKPQWTALITVVLLLVGAAIWFSLVQFLIIKAFCPWCLGTHLTGVLCAISIWRALPSEPSGKGVAPALLPAGLGLAILIIGQAIGPEPKGYAISKETLSGGVPVPENSGERIINMGTGPSFPCLLDRPARIISRNPQDSLHPSHPLARASEGKDRSHHWRRKTQCRSQRSRGKSTPRLKYERLQAAQLTHR